MTKTTYNPGAACLWRYQRRSVGAANVPGMTGEPLGASGRHRQAARKMAAVLLGLVAPFWMVWCSTAAASARASRAPFVLVCVAETPAVAPGATIPLRVWATTPEGEPIKSPVQYLWEVDTGSVTPQGNRAQWHVGDVQMAPDDRMVLRAKVQVRDAKGTRRKCLIEVFVAQPSVPPPAPLRGRWLSPEARIAGKALLLENEREQPGYGLYSYVLFGSKPSAEETERYVIAIEAYLRTLPNVQELTRYVVNSSLNITYIPVTGKPTPGTTEREWAEGILNVYDYPRAKVLLSQLGEEYSGGPYLVSVRSPLTGQEITAYLFMDLRRIMPSMIPLWIEAFAWLTAKERSWKERNLKELGLNLRNVVKVTGIAIPGITHAIKDWIRFIDHPF